MASLKDPLISSEQSSKSEIVNVSYEDQPSRPVDFVIIACLMCSTYGLIIGVFVGLVSWSTKSPPSSNWEKYYHENMYFNLIAFLVYIVFFGSLWFFSIGKREIYRQQLMEAQLALKEGLK